MSLVTFLPLLLIVRLRLWWNISCSLVDTESKIIMLSSSSLLLQRLQDNLRPTSQSMFYTYADEDSQRFNTMLALAKMGKRKVNNSLIPDESIRRVTFKKRKGGLLKKISELTILCGIPACAIIYSDYSDQPEVWPSPSDAIALLDRLHKLPIEKQRKQMLDEENCLSEAIDKATRELEKQEMRNYALDLGLVASGCVASDEDLNDADYSEQLFVSDRLLERQIGDVDERIRAAEMVQ